MAPLPPNTTTRVFFDYRTGSSGVLHTLILRPQGGSPDDIDGSQEALLAALNALTAANFRSGWQVTAVRVAQQGQDFTAPVPRIPGLVSFQGTDPSAFTPEREALEFRFQGRSNSTGRRVSFSLYGLRAGIPTGTLRYNGGPAGFNLNVRNVVQALNTLNTHTRVIDGSTPLWYDYVNLQYNSYWERRIRVGT